VASVILRPNSDISIPAGSTKYPSELDYYFEAVDEATPDDDSSYVFSLRNNAVYFGVEAPPENLGEIVSVRLYVRGKQTSSKFGIIRLGVKIDSIDYLQSDSPTTASAYRQFMHFYKTNPATEEAWSWNDIANLGVGYSYSSGNADCDFRCTQVFIEVEYVESPIESEANFAENETSIGDYDWPDLINVSRDDAFGSSSPQLLGTPPYSWTSVMLVKAGVITGNDKATGETSGLPDWHVFGGDSDLWGLVLAPSDVNDTDFGLAVSIENGLEPPRVMHYLKLTDFMFNVPSGATINGVAAAIKSTYNAIICVRLIVYYSSPVSTPTVTSSACTNTDSDSTQGNGNITDTGGENCTRRGFCYKAGTSGDPNVDDDSVEDESGSFGTGSFDLEITGLTPGTAYRVRAFAENSAGVGYGTTVQVYTNKDATSSDTGAGSESILSKGMGIISDAGAGVDSTNALLAALSGNDTGEGEEAQKDLAPQSEGDSGSGADTILSRLISTMHDLGSGSDVLLSRLIGALESGAGIDTARGDLEKFSSDAGASILENSYLRILEGVKDSHDTGSGVESSSLLGEHTDSDTGSGVEAVMARLLYARELPAGAVDLAKVLTATIASEDTGAGAESSLMAIVLKAAESGSGVDTASLLAFLEDSDSGTIAEAVTVLAAMVAHDTGAGIDEVLSFLRTLVDSGSATETVILVGYVGRLMRLISYVQKYSKLVSYARKYSDLKSYAGEVRRD
jgi:hypothetical protein